MGVEPMNANGQLYTYRSVINKLENQQEQIVILYIILQRDSL